MGDRACGRAAGQKGQGSQGGEGGQPSGGGNQRQVIKAGGGSLHQIQEASADHGQLSGEKQQEVGPGREQPDQGVDRRENHHDGEDRQKQACEGRRGQHAGQPEDRIIDHEKGGKAEVGIVFPIIVGSVPVIGDLLLVALSRVVGIIKGGKLWVHVQVKLDLPLFEGVQLLHIGVYDHLRRADFLQRGIGAQQGVIGVLGVKGTAADQQAQKQYAQVHQPIAEPSELVLPPVDAEVYNEKEGGKGKGHQEQPQSVYCQRLPFVQRHGEKEDRLRERIRKSDAQPGQGSMALKAHSKGIFRAAGIYLEAARAHGLVGAGLVADTDVSGQDARGPRRAERHAARRHREIVKGNGRVLRKQGQSLPVPAVHGGQVDLRLGVPLLILGEK